MSFFVSKPCLETKKLSKPFVLTFDEVQMMMCEAKYVSSHTNTNYDD